MRTVVIIADRVRYAADWIDLVKTHNPKYYKRWLRLANIVVKARG